MSSGQHYSQLRVLLQYNISFNTSAQTHQFGLNTFRKGILFHRFAQKTQTPAQVSNSCRLLSKQTKTQTADSSVSDIERTGSNAVVCPHEDTIFRVFHRRGIWKDD
jgi:hypothetical protein